ncbi:MAG: hypothetical protein ACI4TB_10415 [Lachnospiraceae bacterium]
MEALLKQAKSGEEAALMAAADAIKALPRDEEGVLIADMPGKNVYEAGMLLYPVYMDYETKLGKKAGYADIVSQLTVLGERLSASYNLKDAADYVATLVEALFVMSPEIYEHYKKLLDLLKKYVKLVMHKENLVLTEFPENRFKGDVSGKDKDMLAVFGKAVLAACEKDLLLAEKYEAVGTACVTI